MKSLGNCLSFGIIENIGGDILTALEACPPTSDMHIRRPTDFFVTTKGSSYEINMLRLHFQPNSFYVGTQGH